MLLAVLIVFINAAVSATADEELANNTTIEAIHVPVFTSSTENILNLLNLENLQPNLSATHTETEFNSLSFENVPTTSTSLRALSPSTSASTSSNELKDTETTPSWELIYPEQNSTTTETSISTLTSTTEFVKAILPKYFKVDDVSNCEKFFGQCLKQVLAKVVPKLKDVNKSLSIPSLDPIYFNATAFQYNSGPFTGFITIRYALIHGLTTMQFQSADFYKQHDKFKARLIILLPEMTASGSYKGDMHINNVRVRPRGDFNVSVKDLGIDLLTLGVLFHKDEHTFLKFTKSNATTLLKESKINATGIFPDQRLNDIVVNVANQYWRDLFNIVLNETRHNWLPILLNALNTALDMVPFDFFANKN